MHEKEEVIICINNSDSMQKRIIPLSLESKIKNNTKLKNLIESNDFVKIENGCFCVILEPHEAKILG